MYSEKFDAIVIGTGITGGWAAKELLLKNTRKKVFNYRITNQK